MGNDAQRFLHCSIPSILMKREGAMNTARSEFKKRKDRRPHVVIVGAGFGGLQAAKRLSKLPIDITVVDKRNYHLFQPLLYQVATADLSPADVAWPIRGMFSGRRNVAVLLARVVGIDTESCRVLTAAQGAIPYDYLVIATGAQHSYFGNDVWAPDAPGLKRISDAIELRKRILVAFERAEATNDALERRRQLNFIVIGGGPTGVEMAGSIAELAHVALCEDFRRINPSEARIVLIEAGSRLLAAFPAELSAHAKTDLERLGVEVMVGRRVTGIDGAGVAIDGECLPAATKIWAAGVAASPAGRWLGTATDRIGRIPVGGDLAVGGFDNIFAIGDTAACNAWSGKPVPGIAPAAKQAGAHVARVIAARLGLERDPGPFRYRHFGNLATIGRHSAVIDFGRVKLTGWLAWWLWGLTHIYFLIGVRSPAIVAAQWFWAYLSHRKGARLITGLSPQYEPPAPAAADAP